MPPGQYHGRHRAPRARRDGATARRSSLLLAAATGLILVTNTGAAPAGQRSTHEGPHTATPDTATPDTATPDTPTPGTPAKGTPAKGTRPGAMDRADVQRQVSRSAHRVAVTAPDGPHRAPAGTADRVARDSARHEARATAEREQRERRETARAWVAPLSQLRDSSGFGYRWGRLHAGSDFSVPVGTPVRAMSSGTVTSVSYNPTSGNRVEVEYWDGTVSYYFHLSARAAVPGERVSPGEVVGYSGSTGRSTGPHLHLEIHPGGGAPINPMPWLAARGLT